MTADFRGYLQKAASRTVGPLLGHSNNAKIVKDFAERLGLVYFGYVNQKDDEHRLIRGATLSLTHKDNYYCIGTYNKYDIMMTVRSDLVYSSGHTEAYEWLITVFDFHAHVDLPHIIIVPKSFSPVLYRRMISLHSSFIPLPTGYLTSAPESFIQNFTVYSRASSSLEISSLLNSDIMQFIGAQLADNAIEIADGALYMYSDDLHHIRQSLGKIVSTGVMLTNKFDAQMGVSINID